MIESLHEQIIQDVEAAQTEQCLDDADFIAVLPAGSESIAQIRFQPPPDPDPAAHACSDYLHRASARDAERNRRQHLQAQRGMI
jgi:hypothetical protein